MLTPKPAHRKVTTSRWRTTAFGNGNDTNDLVFTGMAVLNPALFADAPEGPFNIARTLYFPAAAAGRLTGEVFPGAWFDIGSPSQLKAVRRLTD